MNTLKFLFPLLMVIGAIGSAVVNLITHGDHPVTMQWVGAAILYTALLMRNIGG